MVPTSLRGFHFYSPIWTNIASGQELYFRNQPQNPYDGNAIGGFLSGFLIFHRFYDKFLIDGLLLIKK